ncbi:MAG TPA: molybdopterin molybdotransferase MoeA [Gammaproteobacteria bacterium]|nr:molybdopterin molybdotransferase MoeA [Gammaproteobacteria bacterium]
MTQVTPAEAEALILAHMPRFPSREEPIADCVARVLAEDVVADRDQPPFDRVTMDGIAIAYRDWQAGTRAFDVVGTQAAGAPALATTKPAQCVEVMTGAMLPRGTDTVIPVERVERRAGAASVVASTVVVASRQFVHRRAADRAAGSVVLPAGTRIGAPEMAVLANAGRPKVAVAALPRVAVISTGDELVDVGEPLAPYQIRSTNDRALEAGLARERLALVTRTRLPDDGAALADAIARLDETADALILSGGVSMGQFDLVPGVLQSLGAKLVFHRIRQRPGKPMWFGLSARGKPIFALPGNPVSTLVCATRYIMPALRQALGERPGAPELVALSEPSEASQELTYFIPVKLASSAAGVLLAAPRPTNTSGDFVALAGTDGFVELPPRRGDHPPGTVARLYRW